MEHELIVALWEYGSYIARSDFVGKLQIWIEIKV
jgi:hypothetical protein